MVAVTLTGDVPGDQVWTFGLSSCIWSLFLRVYYIDTLQYLPMFHLP